MASTLPAIGSPTNSVLASPSAKPSPNRVDTYTAVPSGSDTHEEEDIGRLHLAGSYLGDSVGLAIAKALPLFTHLQQVTWWPLRFALLSLPYSHSNISLPSSPLALAWPSIQLCPSLLHSTRSFRTHQVNLAHNALSDATVAALVAGVLQLRALRELELTGNAVGAKTCHALSRGVTRGGGPALTTLKLADCGVSSAHGAGERRSSGEGGE